jgi:hypothetical protein
MSGSGVGSMRDADDAVIFHLLQIGTMGGSRLADLHSDGLFDGSCCFAVVYMDCLDCLF